MHTLRDTHHTLNVASNARKMKFTQTYILIIGLYTLIGCGQSTSDKSIRENTTSNMEESTYPEKFDTTNLTEIDKQILMDFFNRRKMFDNYIKESNLDLFTCPGCGYPTLSERGGYEICAVCNWEDDNQDDPNADEVLGGPNYELSLTENRLIIGRTLQELADSLSGKIMENPTDIMKAFDNHKKRMDSIDDDKLMTAERSDPIWTEWENKSREILNDLIEK